MSLSINTHSVVHRTLIDCYGWQSQEDFDAGLPPDPALSWHHEGNLVTSAGVNAIWSLVTGGTNPAPFNNSTAYIAVGSSSTAAASGQTALTSELGRKLATVAISGVGITFSAVFGTSDANGSWNEVGVLNASSSGTLLNRAVITTVSKTGSNVYSVVVTITLG